MDAHPWLRFAAAAVVLVIFLAVSAVILAGCWFSARAGYDFARARALSRPGNRPARPPAGPDAPPP